MNGTPSDKRGSDSGAEQDWAEGSPPPAEGFWSWLRRTARLWGFLGFVIVMLVVFRQVILPFVIAMLVAYILAPLIRYMSRVRVAGRAVPRFVPIILVYAVVLGLMALFITSFVPRLSRDIKRVVQETPAFWEKIRQQWVPSVAAWAQQSFGQEHGAARRAKALPVAGASPGRVVLRQKEGGETEIDISHLQLDVQRRSDDQWTVRPHRPQDEAGQGSERVADAIKNWADDLVRKSEMLLNQAVRLGQRFLLGIFKTITTFILVLMISAFILTDTGRILGWLRTLVPERYYPDFDNVVFLIDKGLSGAIRGQFIICLINGALTWVGLKVIGVKYPLLLALLATVMSLIPIFGSIISSIPIVIVALVSGSHGVDILSGALILVWIIGIHLLEANLLNPKIMGTAARIHPVLVIFAVVAGERTYGPIGALLGVPLFSAVQAVFVYLRQRVKGAELKRAEPT